MVNNENKNNIHAGMRDPLSTGMSYIETECELHYWEYFTLSYVARLVIGSPWCLCECDMMTSRGEVRLCPCLSQ